MPHSDPSSHQAVDPWSKQGARPKISVSSTPLQMAHCLSGVKIVSFPSCRTKTFSWSTNNVLDEKRFSSIKCMLLVSFIYRHCRANSWTCTRKEACFSSGQSLRYTSYTTPSHCFVLLHPHPCHPLTQQPFPSQLPFHNCRS